MTHGKIYNKSPRRINHKATKSKTNTGTTALERSVVRLFSYLFVIVVLSGLFFYLFLYLESFVQLNGNMKTIYIYIYIKNTHSVTYYVWFQGGMYVLTLFNWYAASYALMLLSLLELAIVAWIYGKYNNTVAALKYIKLVSN